MPHILLYQPYYHFPGHFKSQFHAFQKNLTELGYSCLGVLGLQQSDIIEKSMDIYPFHYKTQNRTIRIFTNLMGFSRVRHVLQQEEIAAIHFLDIEIFLLFLFIRFNRPLFKNIRIVITQHSINRLQNRSSPFVRMYKRFIFKAFAYLEQHHDLKILTNGKNITKWITSEGMLSTETVETIWWGSDYETDKIDWEEKTPNSFLFYGIIRKDKNLEFLLDTISNIDQPFHLHIAGYPRDYSPDDLHKLLHKYGLTDQQVTLELEYLSEERIADLLSSSTFILLPYNRDNLSNSGPLIDSIQFGCIPIASGYGERRELITNFDVGYLFYFDHSPTLIDVLNNCYKNPDKNSYYQKNIEDIKKRFTWEWIIRDLVINKKVYDPKI